MASGEGFECTLDKTTEIIERKDLSKREKS